MNMELRVLNAELTSNDDGTMKVSGYVNKTEQFSNVLGVTKRFVEKIAKGAFTRAIQNAKRDIDFLAEHQKEKILSSTRNGSLTLREDDEGLFMEATITPTSWGKDAYTLINSKIYQNMSFGFRTVKDSWKAMSNGLHERTIEELELFEVSVVKDPAYSQSTIAARGIDLIEDIDIPAEIIEKENHELEQFEKVLEKLDSIDKRFDAISEQLKEDRADDSKEDEKENREEIDLEALAEAIVKKLESLKAEEDRANDDKKDEEDEEAKKEDPKADESPDKKTEDSEDEKDKEKDEEKDQKRSQDPAPNFSEFRKQLDLLTKLGGTQS